MTTMPKIVKSINHIDYDPGLSLPGILACEEVNGADDLKT
jgi:hypothetical protein